jgi:hypothetical protein
MAVLPLRKDKGQWKAMLAGDFKQMMMGIDQMLQQMAAQGG